MCNCFNSFDMCCNICKILISSYSYYFDSKAFAYCKLQVSCCEAHMDSKLMLSTLLHKQHYRRSDPPPTHTHTIGLGRRLKYSGCNMWSIAGGLSHEPVVLIFKKSVKILNRTNVFYTRSITTQLAIEPSNEHIFSQRNTKCA